MIIRTIRTIRTNDPMSCDCWDRVCGVSSVKSQIKPRIVRRETSVKGSRMRIRCLKCYEDIDN